MHRADGLFSFSCGCINVLPTCVGLIHMFGQMLSHFLLRKWNRHGHPVNWPDTPTEGKKDAYLAGKEAIKITEIASSFSSRLLLQMDFIKEIRIHMHH